MFVLCPHCHFLVGIDPRTGKPPAVCPKCGGVVVESLPDMPVEGVHAEDVPAPLAPFAPVELPSVLPTLPEIEPVAEQGRDEQMQLQVPAPAPAEPITEQAVPVEAPAPASSAAINTAAPPEPKPRLLLRRKAKPAAASGPATPETATPEPKPRWWSRRNTGPAPPPAPVASAAATSAPKRRWWSRRRTEPAPAPPPAISTAETEAAAPPPAPITTPASPAAQRAGAMIAAMQGRRRTIGEPVATSNPPVVPAVVASEVEIDALPPAVQIEDVFAATSADAGIEAPAEVPKTPPKRRLRTSAASAADVDRAATTASAIGSAAASTPVVVPVTSTPVDSWPANSRPLDSRPADSVSADLPVPPHPLRRRTDFDPNATPEPVAGTVPTHPLRRRTDAPSFTRPRARANAAARIGWRSLVAAGGLSLLLMLQLLLAQRDTLAASPRWRPMIAAMCATLRCSLPAWHEPAAFTMLSRDVRPHPGAPGTLLINASFRNDADWPQPWPRLLLTLSDLDGRMVGARSFAADDYLGAAPTQSELAPGQTAAVTLSVVEPAPNIVAFTFDFR